MSTTHITKQIEAHLRSIAFESAGVKNAGAAPPVLLTSAAVSITTVGGVSLITSPHMAPKLVRRDKRRVVIVGSIYVEQFMRKLHTSMERLK